MLDGHAVRLVVVGGVAGTMAGSPVATNDLDVVYDRSPDNLERLVTALAGLRALRRVERGR